MGQTGSRNGVAVYKNISFDHNGTLPIAGEFTAKGQLLIGSTADPNIVAVANTLTEGSGISITNGDGTIEIAVSGSALNLNKIGTQTGVNPVVPDATGKITLNGAVVAAGTNPVRSNGTGSTVLAVEVQTSQAIAATDATKVGLANFDSTSFSVDANGFVQSLGGGFTWNDVSGAFSPLKNNGYIAQLTANGTLPASPSQGDTIKFYVDHDTQDLTITANTGQTIRIGSAISSTAGTALSSQRGDSCTLVFRSTGSVWMAIEVIGNWILS